MDTVKASELLLKISLDVGKIKEMVKLQGYQYNLILKRLNELENLGQKKPPPINSGGATVKATESIPLGTLSVPKEDIKVENKSISQVLKPAEPNKIVEVDDKKYSFDDRMSQKVPITQLVYTENGKPVAIAAVELIDENGNIFEKLKTNSVGRWSALVYPGKYKVHLTRKYGTYLIEFEQEFEVTSGSTQIEILPPEQYRRK